MIPKCDKIYLRIVVIITCYLFFPSKVILSQEIFFHLFPNSSIVSEPGNKNQIFLFTHPLNLLKQRYVVFSYCFNYEDIYREKKNNVISSSVSNLSNKFIGTIPLRSTILQGVFAFSLHQHEVEVIDYNLTRQKIGFYNENHSYLFSYAKDFFSSIKLGISLKDKHIANKNFYEYSFEAMLQPFSWINTTYSRSSSNLNYRLELTYEDLLVDLPLNFTQLKDSFLLSFSLVKNWKLSLEYQTSFIKENKVVSSKSNYLLNPEGDNDKWELSLAFKFRKKLRFVFSGRQESFNSTGRLYYKNQQFGKITCFKFDRNAFLVRLHFQMSRHHVLRGDYAWADFEGTAKGHIESWPFTTTVIDLLGSREYFRTSGNIKLEKLRLGYHLLTGTSSSFWAGLDYIKIEPDNKLSTWKPLFLVFGVQDLKRYYLKYEKADGLMVNLGVNYKFHQIIFNCSFSQFIPISVKKKEQGLKPSAGPSERKKTNGGRFYSFIVSYVL